MSSLSTVTSPRVTQ